MARAVGAADGADGVKTAAAIGCGRCIRLPRTVAIAQNPRMSKARDRHQFEVNVATRFLDDQSEPRENRFVFAYTVTIANRGEVPARLVARHWIITDANGKVQEVRGEGVVGEQPWMRPGDDFQYTSGAVLETAVGTMRGSYQMIADDGTRFDAPIAEFTLAIPRTLH
jgi:ApaG protein